MRSYSPVMSISKLFAILLALAVMAAPASAVAGAAMPAHHGAAMAMDKGHCDTPPAKSDRAAPDTSCCMAMCMAVAVAPAEPLALDALPGASPYFAVAATSRGHTPEIATPPPRTA